MGSFDDINKFFSLLSYQWLPINSGLPHVDSPSPCRWAAERWSPHTYAHRHTSHHGGAASAPRSSGRIHEQPNSPSPPESPCRREQLAERRRGRRTSRKGDGANIKLARSTRRRAQQAVVASRPLTALGGTRSRKTFSTSRSSNPLLSLSSLRSGGRRIPHESVRSSGCGFVCEAGGVGQRARSPAQQVEVVIGGRGRLLRCRRREELLRQRRQR